MKSLKELRGKPRNVKRKGGKKIDFGPIAKKIIDSGTYYSVKEVWTRKDMVNRAVSRFRTMKLLNNQVKGGRMCYFESEGKYWYGKVPPKGQ